MQHVPDTPIATSLGADLRALRKARGLTLHALAQQLGRSIGWVSQIERDLSAPDHDDLRQIAKSLCVPVSLFFGHTKAPAHEHGHVVRADARRAIGAANGLTESLVSPDLTDEFEVVHSVFAPGAARLATITRPTQEVGFVISGRLTLQIAGQTHELGPGDSFRIRAEPFKWSAPNPEQAVVLWVIAPPVY